MMNLLKQMNLLVKGVFYKQIVVVSTLPQRGEKIAIGVQEQEWAEWHGMSNNECANKLCVKE